MEQELQLKSKKQKFWNVFIYVIIIILITQMLYELARWQRTAFVLGIFLGFFIALWVYVIANKYKISSYIEMEKTQNVILEQNMVIILALEKIGAIEKNDSENLR